MARLSRRDVLKTMPAAVLAGCSQASRSGAGDSAVLELGARDAARAIARGEVTAEAYAKLLLGQYTAHKDLNCVITIAPDKVLEAARAVDVARGRGEALGPMAGVPFAVKDQIDAFGYPTTGGNGALKANFPNASAPVVEALMRAGGIVFAKTAMPDMVAGGSIMATDASWNRDFGNPRNPYDLKRITGGSSGGNGAIVAARIVPAAIGEDTTGSVRLPAACCGIAGLRPSTYTVENALSGTNRKRWSDDGIVIPPAGLLDTFGPMARTVADVAFIDALVTGETAAALDLKTARVAVPRADYWQAETIDAGVAQVMQAVFAKLRDAGATLVEVDLAAVLEIANAKVNQALRRPVGRGLAEWLAANGAGVTMEQVYAGRPVPTPAPQELMTGQERAFVLETAAKAFADFFRTNGVVAVAMPTLGVPAPPLDEAGAMKESFPVNGKMIHNRRVVPVHLNLSPRMGGPGLSMPAGLSEGLPVGLLLEGMPGDDARILGLGLAVEAVLGRIPAPTFKGRVV